MLGKLAVKAVGVPQPEDRRTVRNRVAEQEKNVVVLLTLAVRTLRVPAEKLKMLSGPLVRNNRSVVMVPSLKVACPRRTSNDPVCVALVTIRSPLTESVICSNPPAASGSRTSANW